MTERVHEWEIGLISKGVQLEFVGECAVDGCNEVLSQKEVNCRLNEYETLKAATERLSADQAKDIAADIRLRDYAKFAEQWRDKYSEKLYTAALTYANILEGKDD